MLTDRDTAEAAALIRHGANEATQECAVTKMPSTK